MKKYLVTIAFVLGLIGLSVFFKSANGQPLLSGIQLDLTPHQSEVQQLKTFPLEITQADAVHYKSAVVRVETEPQAQVSIRVVYCEEAQARSASLGEGVSDAYGAYSWYWYPETLCKGNAQALVTGEWQGIEEQTSVEFAMR